MSQIPSLSLYESSFIDPPLRWKTAAALETLLVTGKEQPGSTPGRGHGGYVVLGSAYRLNSNQEGQSGERRRGGRFDRERLTTVESGGRDPQLK